MKARRALVKVTAELLFSGPGHFLPSGTDLIDVTYDRAFNLFIFTVEHYSLPEVDYLRAAASDARSNAYESLRVEM